LSRTGQVNCRLIYNAEVERYKLNNDEVELKNFVNNDPTKISWSSSLLPKVAKGIKAEFSSNNIVKALYRPFSKQWLYFDGMFNHRQGQMPSIFPDCNSENLAIVISGRGENKKFSCLMSNNITEAKTLYNSQVFPLYLYKTEIVNGNKNLVKNSAISDYCLEHFLSAYPNSTLKKEDIFYYIYSLFHSTDYIDKFSENLTKEMPRIPCVKTEKDFWLFSNEGKKLASLHLNYETVDCYPVTLETKGKSLDELNIEDFYVTKMKYEKSGNTKNLTTVIYNNQITIKDIPTEAYEYVINEKSALD